MKDSKLIHRTLMFPIIVTIIIFVSTFILFAITKTFEFTNNTSSITNFPELENYKDVGHAMEFIPTFILIVNLISLLFGILLTIDIGRYILHVDSHFIRITRSSEIHQEIKVSNIKRIYKLIEGRQKVFKDTLRSTPRYYIVIESFDGEGIKLNNALYKKRDLDWIKMFLKEQNPAIEIEKDTKYHEA